MKKNNILAFILIILVLAGALWVGKAVIYPPPMRALAEEKDFYIGVAVNGWYLNDQQYANTLTREFNILTAENAMKFGPLSPEPGQYNFTEADAIMYFAIENGMRVRGHTLVWTNQLPAWLTEGQWTRDELIQILHDHITTLVGRYRGYILAWDVVNEAITDEGAVADNFWMSGIGPDYIEMAFRWAHEADPDALLFYNDFNAEGIGPKSDGVYEMVAALVQQGVPIHGVGMEMHTAIDRTLDLDAIAANMQRLEALGLQVHITEMDVRVPAPATAEALDQQARIYQDMLQTCLDAPNCTAFVMWGLSDAYSWIPTVYPDWGSALILDEDYQPKPAYQAMYKLLR